MCIVQCASWFVDEAIFSVNPGDLYQFELVLGLGADRISGPVRSGPVSG